MSNIKGTVTTLRQFLFNVESEVKTEVNGIKYPIIYNTLIAIPQIAMTCGFQASKLIKLLEQICKSRFNDTDDEYDLSLSNDFVISESP